MDDKIRCIVVDDEPLACRLMASYVTRTDSLELVGAYTSSLDAKDAILATRPDIVFLDIEMPRLSGLDIARDLPPETRPVFTTAYPDFALEGFEVNALHYLLKPVTYERFIEALSRAEALKNQAKTTTADTTAYISVKSDYHLVRITVADIVYIQALKDYIKIYTATNARPIMTHMSMKAVEVLLANVGDFRRVHRSFIVNVSRITAMRNGRLDVDGCATTIPVSDSVRADLIKLF